MNTALCVIEDTVLFYQTAKEFQMENCLPSWAPASGAAPPIGRPDGGREDQRETE